MDILISKKVCNFISLTQTNNIARAVKKIRMTASPSSKSIAVLEEQIGYALFTRKDNNISLNKAEQELYQKLFPAYQRPSAIDNEIHNSGRHSREIVISIDNTYPTIIFDQLTSLGDKYEGVTTQPVESSENGAIDNLLDRQLDFIISPRHVFARVQELENPTISKLSPLRLGFLVSRCYEERQEQELLQELPRPQIRFRNRANFETMIDVNMQPYGVNPTIIYRPYSLMAKISAVERGYLLTVILYLARRLVNPVTLKYFGAPHRPMYMQEYLYSIKNYRYITTILQHIAEDRDGTNH